MNPTSPQSSAPGLRPYQRAGVQFLTRASLMLRDAGYDPRSKDANATGDLVPAFLADDPGLGKSAQFVTFALDCIKRDLAYYQLDESKRTQNMLVMSPSIGRVSWAIEGPKWLPSDWKVLSVKDGITGKAQDKTLYVCSYDLAAVNAGVRNWLRGQRWAVLALDEAHYLKSPEAKRTQFVYGKHCDGGIDSLVVSARMTVCLSGTPTPNNAGELWTHLNALRPGLLREAGLKSRIEFEDAFCTVRVGQYGRQLTGSKNQDQLRKLCKSFILRRRKQDVLKDLPAIQVQDTPLDLTDKERAQAVSLATKLAASVLPLTNGDVPEDDDALVELLSKSGANVAAARRALGIMKAPASATWINARLENGTKKLIVFAYHRDVLDILQDNIGVPSVRIDGATPQDEREQAVNDFQNKPEVRVFLGQLQAAGTAITLTAASEVAMVEADWVPGVNDQAISRAHRMGQKNGVLATFLFMPGTIDQRIMRAFRRKAEQTLSIYDPSAVATPPVLNDPKVRAAIDAAKEAAHAREAAKVSNLLAQYSTNWQDAPALKSILHDPRELGDMHRMMEHQRELTMRELERKRFQQYYEPNEIGQPRSSIVRGMFNLTNT